MSCCRLIVFGLLCASFAGCGDSSDGGEGPCETDPIPAPCGATCSDVTPCAAGYYCTEDGTCTADCAQGADEQCDDGETCNSNGECVEGNSDAGGNTDDGGGDVDAADCPAVEVTLTPVVPLVTLLIDQSLSMEAGFPDEDDPSRWEALKTALIGPNNGQDGDGIVFQLQSRLNMGATLYTNFEGQPGCPELQTAAPAVNNADAIRELLTDNEPASNTPTGQSVDAVVDDFPASDNPRVIVLATDGLPDTCENPNPSDQEQNAANAVTEVAVQRAYDADITTVVLSVGLDVAEDHLQRVANAGQGLALDTQQPAAADFAVAANPAQLITQFEEIIGDLIRDCEIEVDGNVDLNRASEGTVTLNGETLEYGEGNDWIMVDQNTLELLGDACETFRTENNVTLTAEFPCGGIIVD